MRRSCCAGLLPAFCLVALIFCSAACGGSSQLAEPQAGAPLPGAPPSEQPWPAPAPVAAAIAEVRSAETPAGVEPELFNRLQAELVAVLSARAETRIAAAAPTGSGNAVADLRLIRDGAGEFRLEWTYRNIGDYNLDGLVGVTDLTPIGQHYEVSASDPDWGMAQRADGNADGLVTVSDITPIGQHYQSFVAGYNIYGADSVDGARSAVASLGLPAVQSPGQLRMSCEVLSDGFEYYWVVPHDGDGHEGEPSLPSVPSGDAVLVQFGSTTALVTQTLGPEGGMLSGPPSSPLEGISIEFPEGALAEPTAVSLGYNDGLLELPLEAISTPLIVIDSGGQQQYAFPVSITTPYPRGGDLPNVAIPYTVDEDGRFELLGASILNVEGNQFTTGTFHSGTFVIALLRPELLNGQTGHYLTSFNPVGDAFQVYNTGSVYNPGGECAGMSSFAVWYWQNHADNRGDLYPRFMYSVGDLKGQDVIATRAFNSIAQKYSEYCSEFLANRTAGDYYNWSTARYTLLLTATPVLIDLAYLTDAIGDGRHSVLAYGYDDGGLWVYDPNLSHVPGYITYTPTGIASGSFTKYGEWDRIAFWGGGAIKMTETYQNILYDAETRFTDTGYAEISITSHANGEEVGTGTTRLIGNIHSGSILVDKLQVFINQQMFEVPVQENGTFGVDIPIQPGLNAFHFTTWGQGGSSVNPLFIPNNHPLGTFSLQGNPVPAVLSVTLTWSRDDTDVDLYVIDPTGDYSSYSHPNTADGGELSIDNETGFGPEYWALRTNDTVRWGQGYRLRAHYFNDNGHGGVILVAKIVQYEGTPQQQITTKFLYLPSSNTLNTDPLAVGPDWKDIGLFAP